MSAGKSLQRVVEELRGGGWIYLVDAQGMVHQLTVEHYSDLTAAQLENSRIFTQADAAERFAERRRASRN